MKDFLHHLFIPRESNNHRPKVLHHKSLFLIIVALIVGQLIFSSVETKHPSILGVNTDISVGDLLLLTNKERQQKNFQPLILNKGLSEAAMLKARDMFENNYWSHSSPTGVTPWYFIQKSGYEYVYAGENLARGFSTSESIMRAWMVSPTHKDNILSQNYQEVGFAIAKGKLLGEDTILVVEMFGKNIASSQPETTAKQLISGAASNSQLLDVKIETGQPFINSKPLIDANALSWDISVILISIFILILILDMIIVEKKKIIRLVGHNLGHIIFLGGILAAIIIFTRGVII